MLMPRCWIVRQQQVARGLDVDNESASWGLVEDSHGLLDGCSIGLARGSESSECSSRFSCQVSFSWVRRNAGWIPLELVGEPGEGIADRVLVEPVEPDGEALAAHVLWTGPDFRWVGSAHR
jgi:hypothetical protein